MTTGHEIPYIIRKMAADGVLEEMPCDSFCPSFSAAFRDGHRRRLWACVWIENRDTKARKTWSTRFTLTVQPDPTVFFGRRVIGTDDLSELVVALNRLLKGGFKDKQGRFMVLPAEGA